MTSVELSDLQANSAKVLTPMLADKSVPLTWQISYLYVIKV